MVGAKVTLDLSKINAAFGKLAGQGIKATISNTARSADGTYYFFIVNNGRGEVRPKNAKALHWVNAEGEDVFSMYSGPTAPQHILENSLPAIKQLVKARAGYTSVKKFGRTFVVDFVNSIAEMAVEELRKNTPVNLGTLKESYKVTKAK